MCEYQRGYTTYMSTLTKDFFHLQKKYSNLGFNLVWGFHSLKAAGTMLPHLDPATENFCQEELISELTKEEAPPSKACSVTDDQKDKAWAGR